MRLFYYSFKDSIYYLQHYHPQDYSSLKHLHHDIECTNKGLDWLEGGVLLVSLNQSAKNIYLQTQLSVFAQVVPNGSMLVW